MAPVVSVFLYATAFIFRNHQNKLNSADNLTFIKMLIFLKETGFDGFYATMLKKWHEVTTFVIILIFGQIILFSANFFI